MFSQGAADVPCTLLHFVNNELVDVAKGKIVQPGNPLFHGTQMQPNLFRVQLVQVLPGCDDLLPPIRPVGADDDDVMTLSCLPAYMALHASLARARVKSRKSGDGRDGPCPHPR